MAYPFYDDRVAGQLIRRERVTMRILSGRDFNITEAIYNILDLIQQRISFVGSSTREPQQGRLYYGPLHNRFPELEANDAPRVIGILVEILEQLLSNQLFFEANPALAAFRGTRITIAEIIQVGGQEIIRDEFRRVIAQYPITPDMTDEYLDLAAGNNVLVLIVPLPGDPRATFTASAGPCFELSPPRRSGPDPAPPRQAPSPPICPICNSPLNTAATQTMNRCGHEVHKHCYRIAQRCPVCAG